jgi:hypothetical protein
MSENAHLLEEILADQFGAVEVHEKRIGVYQLLIPMYYHDGDMVELFAMLLPGNKVRLFDEGFTLMRLSYTFDYDTTAGNKMLRSILGENDIDLIDEMLVLECSLEDIVPALLRFTSTQVKVLLMRMYSKSKEKSSFVADLNEFVLVKLNKYKPEIDYNPKPGLELYKVDFKFNSLPTPKFMFGITGQTKAIRTATALRQFLLEDLTSDNIMVFENVKKITTQDYDRVMKYTKKSFESLKDFKKNGEKYFEYIYSQTRFDKYDN